MRSSVLSSIKRFSFFCLAVVCSLSYSLSAQALEPLSRAELLEEQSSRDVEYRLVLSELKRIEARTVGENERFVNGDLKRQLWQLSSSHELSDVIQHYRQQLGDVQTLYQCSALDCGSSNFWANKIFMNAKLYGRDAKQDYAVLLEQADKPGSSHTLYVIYAVQRSKQTTYFNIDVIKTKDPVTDDEVARQQILATLQTEAGWLPGMMISDGRLDEDASQVLLNTVRGLDPSVKRRLYLIVHCYQANNMADNFACSTRIAQQLRAAIYAGSYEIPVYGHGALTLSPGDDLKPHLRFMLWPRQ